MKKQLLLGPLLILLLASCRFLAVDGSTFQEVTPTAVIGVLATTQPKPASPLSAPATSAFATQPTQPAPTAIVPTISPSAAATQQSQIRFRDLRFASDPDARPQQVFPAGTEEIFAVWEYRDMNAGDRVRRIWFRDEQIWLTREELWNANHYQNNGSVRDVSVYDNEGSGLDPGTYRLQLYVNDNLQQEGSFTVLRQ